MERKTSGRVLGLRKTVFAVALLLTGTVASFAQTGNATYIRNFINSQGQCKTGALTSSNGCVAIVGGNGYAASGIPQSLNEHLAAESKAGRTIDDICLTENGSWYCVGDTLRGVNCPQAMINTVNNFCRLGDRILCVTFDDNGNWIVISSGHWSASNTSIEGNMKKAQNMHGNILTAHLGNDGGLAVICQNGSTVFGNVPSSLTTFLQTKLNFAAMYIKFSTNGSWLITGRSSEYAYSM